MTPITPNWPWNRGHHPPPLGPTPSAPQPRSPGDETSHEKGSGGAPDDTSVGAIGGGIAAGRDIIGNAIGEHSTVSVHLPPEEEPSWPIRVGVPPLLATALQPRTGLRAKIDRAWNAANSAMPAAAHGEGDSPGTPPGGRPTQVLSGGGGVGKSQLAAIYAHEAASAGTDLVMWVTATDVGHLLAFYSHAARLVHVPGLLRNDPEHDARAMLDWLATTDRSWLMVFDDVVDLAALASWWPPSRPDRGRTLATTRLKDARLTGQGRGRVDVDVYSPDEAAAYVEQRLAADGASHLLDGGENELAAELGRLPLALGHAVAYLIQQQLTCRQYLVRLRDSRRRLDEMLPRSADGDGYGRQVTTALLLSLAAAEACGPPGLVKSVLSLTALLEPAGHPESLWTTAFVLERLLPRQHPQGDEERQEHEPQAAEAGTTDQPAHLVEPAEHVRTALLMLHRYALITYDVRTATREVGIHSLTARAVREITPEADQAKLAVLASWGLLSIWPYPDQPVRDFAAVLRANADALTRNAEQHLWEGGAHELLFRVGRSLYANGLTHTALAHFAALVERSEQVLGAEHVDTLRFRADLASLHRALGHREEAVWLDEQTLAGFVRALGDDHPYTLGVRANLAASYFALGRRAEAAGVEEQVAADLARVLGPDHQDTLRARGNLAVTYDKLGRSEEALRLQEEVLADRGRVFGADHPETLGALRALSDMYVGLGRLHDALQVDERLLADSERVLGPQHPDTLLASVNLAVIYALIGRYEEALGLCTEALPQYERVFGLDSAETGKVRDNIAVIQSELDRSRNGALRDVVVLNFSEDRRSHQWDR